VGGSLVTAAGLGRQLIASSLTDYVERAISFATTPKGQRSLDTCRHQLLHNRDQYALFDTPRYVRALEDAFDNAWLDWLHGAYPPQPVYKKKKKTSA
jgi:predicted O-linked N-acetylglucosamine transferase (SPINDLY family)